MRRPESVGPLLRGGERSLAEGATWFVETSLGVKGHVHQSAPGGSVDFVRLLFQVKGARLAGPSIQEAHEAFSKRLIRFQHEMRCDLTNGFLADLARIKMDRYGFSAPVRPLSHNARRH
jgi:hypothetical protein